MIELNIKEISDRRKEGTPLKPRPQAELFGCAIPSNKVLWEMENQSYEKTPKNNVLGWTLIEPSSKGIKAFINGNDIVIAIRGTADFRDVKADLQIIFSGITNSSRFKEDLKTLKEIQAKYPPEKYNYYSVSHSLGSAIADELINMGLIKSGVSYNGAVDLLKFKNDVRNHRIYNSDDILYNLMGRFTKNPEVRKNKLGWKGKIASLIPLGKLGNSINAHLLSNFVGGSLIGFHIILH